MIDSYPIVSFPISVNYQYKLADCYWLLVDVKQMSNTLFTSFSTKLKNQIGLWYEIKCRKLLSQVMIRSSFTFKQNHVSVEEEDNPSGKVVIVE